MEKRTEKIITTNRKAGHDYHIIDRIEAGIVLTGTEVKSLREGKASLLDAYALIERGEAWLINAHIPQFKQGSYFNHEPKRKRKLLLHHVQIMRLIGKVQEKGLTLIPLKIYFSGPYIKVELGICKGKKSFDHRDDLKEREAKRDIERGMADRHKGK
ncbi:MAG: SsrA-binding protein SmpB [Firmicutes bacterium]|nr:SsrA-binding protein SmpB [Bacillota bacterium]